MTHKRHRIRFRVVPVDVGGHGRWLIEGRTLVDPEWKQIATYHRKTSAQMVRLLLWTVDRIVAR